MGPHKKHKRASTSSDNSDNDSRKRSKKKHKHSKKKRLKKNKHVTSSSESSTSTDSEEERRKERRKLKKQKKLDKKSTKEKTQGTSTDIPLELMEKSKTMAPMTKEEWEKRQSIVRKVYDETTGRHRLIKGDGEVIEEIVSRDRHKAINQQATKGDGAYFQTQISKNIV